MQTAVLLLLLGTSLADGARSRARLNPVTRVVELLQGLSKKIYEDGKAEEDLYEGFVCWAESVITQKTASIAKAKSRVDELEAYLADLKAGKVEFTSERVDLNKDIKKLEKDLEGAKTLREKEHADYLAAEEEMESAIAALEKAGGVLQEATAFTQSKASLLSVRARLGEGVEQGQKESAALDRAIRIGRQFLTRGDAIFLERLLTGEWGHQVPTVDWKKLNRKATFKMSYKARSVKIQDVIQKLLETFEENLVEAEAKEKTATEVFGKLSASLSDSLDKSKAALQEMAEEGAAKGMSLEESQDEIDALNQQMTNDSKFIEQTRVSLDEMKASWKARKALRDGELAAISKAIEVLHSDDARDLMKKSFESQGYLLLQEEAGTAAALRRYAKTAGAMIRSTAAKTGDLRLLALGEVVRDTVHQGGHFDKVLTAIDEMISTLKEEAAQDLATKEICEKKRATQSRIAVLSARKMDELTDQIGKIVAEINEMHSEIKQKEEEKAMQNTMAKRGTEIREAEHQEWMVSDKEDKAAAKLVEAAKEVLASFYKDNNLVFLAQKRVVPTEAGKAPPPPPSTWDTTYAETTQPGQNVVAMLEMVKEDIEKDIAKALVEEDEAAKEYDVFMAETTAAVEELDKSMTELKATAAEKEQEVQEEKTTRLAEKSSLDAVMATIKTIAGECDYYQVNFVGRSKNRDVEIDGLSKAKAILQGAVFGSSDR